MILALLAVSAALLAAIALEFALRQPVWTPGAGGPPPRVEAKLLPAVVATVAEQAYPETTARPIFTPTRRPAPEAVVNAQPAFQRGQFILLGVIAVGNAKTAMLREKSTGRLHRVEAGREVNGIKVSQIDRDSVVLAQGTETETVALTVQRPGNAPGTPGAAAPNAPGQPMAPAAAAGAGPFGASAGGSTPPPVQQGFGGMQAAPPLPSFMQTPGAAPAGVAPQPNSGSAPWQTAPAPVQPPGAAASTPSAEAALTPEEILARRRARRAQQTQ